MKTLTLVLNIIAVVLIIYNATKLNFQEFFQGESMIAAITILASLCAILLLQVLRVSKKIEEKSKG
ncbi:hypothetical protein [Lacinutrix sp. Bg11-31]|uniref:hypothetical protein n=1 Tax=Lacinutrix sp. Bg11-31 TaxID=2057808 RepID=UPI000C3028F4|nr:hypothetical protein [Lacinutrix sp. Bg11-31]AUC82675.1 hypothetical protein CW733_11275 [Lacinutrix sp. Bg11-31]